jgi:hypothetical protein
MLLSLGWLVLMIFAGIAVIAVVIGILRVAARGVVRAQKLNPDVESALGKLKGGAPIRAEMAFGEKENTDGTAGFGGLALYKDEVVFQQPSKAPFRLPLGDITDVIEVRAVSAMDGMEGTLDFKPDYFLKLSWKGGAGTFAVHDAEGWKKSLAEARM